MSVGSPSGRRLFVNRIVDRLVNGNHDKYRVKT